MTGKFIVLEGTDGAGTSTQAKLLAERLVAAGRSVLLTAQPSELEIGRLIRSFLRVDTRELDPRAMAMLFAADRLDHVRTSIAPHLAAGAVVVCDRYTWSSRAYQGLQLFDDEICELNRHALTPDLTIWISVSPDVAQRRVAERKGVPEIFDDGGIQERVCTNYSRLFRSDQSHPTSVVSDNGTQSPAAIADVIWTIAQPVVCP